MTTDVGQNKKRILLFWSGGKNSAFTLYKIIQDNQFEIAGLVCIFDRDKNTVKFHGIPDTLIIDQAKMLKLPLQRIFLSSECSQEEYIDHVGKILGIFAKKGIHDVAFGETSSIEYRKIIEKMLEPLKMKAHFPLWGRQSLKMSDEFIKTGHKALITSIHSDKLDRSFLNCEYDQKFIERLPQAITPFGDSGEFHSFVTFGPHFKMRVPFSKSIAIEEGPYLVSLMKEP